MDRAQRRPSGPLLRWPGARPARSVPTFGIGRSTRWVAVAVLSAAAVTEAAVRTAGPGTHGSFVLVICLLALGSTTPLALPNPAAAVLIAVACVLSLTPFHCLTVAGCLALLVAVYRLGRKGSQLVAGVLVAPFLALSLVAGLAGLGDGWTTVQAIVLATATAAAGWLGAALRSDRQARQHSADRDAIVDTLLEHTARGERARIARELHDVVAHHISMIAVQAETARLTTADLSPAGAGRLSAIGDTARSALTEMRRLLGVLREDADSEVPQRQPQPGLRELTVLLDETRVAAGSAARLIVDGAPDRLDPGVELAAYRIVQEALTNVRRHAPGAAVDVELHYADDAVRVRIRDNGPGPAGSAIGGPPVTGHGLLGMRERATAVGGRLQTGRAAGGGFLVEATLPAGDRPAR